MKKKLVWMLPFLIIGCTAIQRVVDDTVDSAYSVEDDRAQLAPPYIREAKYTINDKLASEGIGGRVKIDFNARIALTGKFENDNEVKRAFAIAQDLVGVQYLSPVEPSDIRSPFIAKCMGETTPGSIISPECKPFIYRPFIGNKQAPSSIGNKYALIVGIREFKNHPDENNLTFADKDATAIRDYLTNDDGESVPKENITLLTNQQATLSAITAALADIKAKAQKDDLVLIYISSHGAPADPWGNANILVYDTPLPKKGEGTYQDRIDSWDKGFQESDLRDFLQTTKAQRVAVLLDSCYSGAMFAHVDKASQNKALAFFKTKEMKVDKALQSKTLAFFQTKEANYVTGQSKEHMKKHLLGLEETATGGKKTGKTDWGRVLISASSDKEKSWEPSVEQERRDNVKNGVFTHYLLKGLRQNKGHLNNAFKTAKQETSAAVRKYQQKEHPGVSQTPQILAVVDNATLTLKGH